MRRTTTYFMGKLKFIHQSNVLDWYENKFKVRACNSTRNIKYRKKREKRIYYQYHGVDDIKIMMDVGEVMSGF